MPEIVFHGAAEEVTGSVVDRQQLFDLGAQAVVVATDTVEERRALARRLFDRFVEDVLNGCRCVHGNSSG